MQTSKKKMPLWLKIPVVILAFFLACFLLMELLWLPVRWMNRQEFNTAIIGGSQGVWGIDAGILSDAEDVKAINLSAGPASMKARFDVLKSAAERYELDTVIIELSQSAFHRDMASWSVYNSAWIIPRFVSFQSAWEYCVKDRQYTWEDYEVVWGSLLDRALDGWKYVLTGRFDEYCRLAGSKKALAHDMVTDPKAISVTYNIWMKDAPYLYNEDEIRIFQETLAWCEEQNLRIVVISLPLAESELWYTSDYDVISARLKETLEGYRCEYYDFSLLRNRQQYFGDGYSFRDDSHLSAAGSDTLSWILSIEILQKDPNEIDPENLFYDSYEEAKEHSTYWTLTEK